MRRVTLLGSLIAAGVGGAVYAVGLWAAVNVGAEGWPDLALRLAVGIIAVAAGVLAGHAYRRRTQPDAHRHPKEESHG